MELTRILDTPKDATNVSFSINGGVETDAAFTANESMGSHITISNNNTAASKTADVDYFDLLITGLSR